MKVPFDSPPVFDLYPAAAIGLLGVLSLALVPADLRATGDFGEHLKEFEKHVPEYTKEIEEFVAEVDAIVAAAREGEDVVKRAEGLVARWEDVKVHGAIETKATPLYAGVWQGMGLVHQAAAEDGSPGAVAEEAEKLKAALWQGLGGVRAAASMVGEDGKLPGSSEHADHDHDHDHGHGEKGHSSPAEAVGHIEHELDEAVSTYADGEGDEAREIIHDAYMGTFEGLEGDLIEQDPDLVTRLEKDFNADLPLLIKEEADLEKVQAKVEEMKARLHSAEKLLKKAVKNESEVF